MDCKQTLFSLIGFPTVDFPLISVAGNEVVHVRFAVVNIRSVDPKYVQHNEMYKLLNSDMLKHFRVSRNTQYDINVIASRIQSIFRSFHIYCDVEARMMNEPIKKCKVHQVEHVTPFHMFEPPTQLVCRNAHTEDYVRCAMIEVNTDLVVSKEVGEDDCIR